MEPAERPINQNQPKTGEKRMALRPTMAEPEDSSPPMPASPLTPKKLFVCTYEGQLGNLCVPVGELVEKLEPSGPVLAINSNFGHKAQRGYERYIKKPAVPKPSRAPAVRRPRKLQGDGTCFNSAAEPVLSIEFPGISRDKVYFVKCFSTTGQTQVPGVLRQDLEDGEAVLRAWVDFLNDAGVGADAEGNPADVKILSSQPNMLNFKFRVVNVSDRMLLRLAAVADYMHTLEVCAVYAERGFTGELWEESLPVLSTALREITPARLPALLPAVLALPPAVLTALLPRLLPPSCPLVVPPFKIKQATPRDILEVKFSCCFVVNDRNVRLNIFQGGKINILGANSFDAAEKIYTFLLELFRACWPEFVKLKPLPDAIRLRQVVAPPPGVPENQIGGGKAPRAVDGSELSAKAENRPEQQRKTSQASGVESFGLEQSCCFDGVPAEAFEEFIAQLCLELGIDVAPPANAVQATEVSADPRMRGPGPSSAEIRVERVSGGDSWPGSFKHLDPKDLLALAAEFEFDGEEDDGSDLQNSSGEGVDGKDEEDYEENPLDSDTKGRWASSAHRAAKPGDNAIRKHVADDEDEQ